MVDWLSVLTDSQLYSILVRAASASAETSSEQKQPKQKKSQVVTALQRLTRLCNQHVVLCEQAETLHALLTQFVQRPQNAKYGKMQQKQPEANAPLPDYSLQVFYLNA